MHSRCISTYWCLYVCMFILTYCIVCTLFAGLFTWLISIFVLIFMLLSLSAFVRFFIKETACLLACVSVNAFTYVDVNIWNRRFVLVFQSLHLRLIAWLGLRYAYRIRKTDILCDGLLSLGCGFQRLKLNIFEHLYSPRMVGKIKEKKQLEHQTKNSDTWNLQMVLWNLWFAITSI